MPNHRVVIIWRVIFVLYALALTVATHWPRLELPPDSPAGDKTIHSIVFLLATFLLACTRWIRRMWTLAAVMLAWAALDEFTQLIPGVNRHASIDDFLANLAGIIIGLIVIALGRAFRRYWKPRPAGAHG